VYLKLCLAGAFTAALCFAQARGQIGQFSAKIALEDGTNLPRQPLVSVRPGMSTACKVRQIFGNGTVIYSAWALDDELRTTDACAVEIRLDGYRTKQATLHDGETVVLKRQGDSEGVATPASSVSAPKGAAKAYGKGVEALRKGNFAEAEQSFQSAISQYPDYAQAYSDLGEALEKQKKMPEAQAAFEKAVALSPKYLKPYAQLARLAISQQRFQDAVEITGRAVKLGALEFPSVYYYRALAYRQLRQLPEAEDSVKQAIELDTDQQMPKSLFLLGLIMEEKGQRDAAIQAYDKYVHLSPKPPDADDVTARITRLKSAGS